MDETKTAEKNRSEETASDSKDGTTSTKTYTEEQLQKAVNDALAAKGRNAKSLEEREKEITDREAKIVEAEKKASEARLAAAASKFGLEVDKVKESGFNNPDLLEKAGELFSATQTKAFKVDSGKTTGGSLSDADFKRRFGDGSLPMTKENMDRYDKIKSTY